MEISFTPSGEYEAHGRERTHQDGAALSALSGTDLRWYYFLGRLSITHSGIDIGPPWGWVPLFDAMYCVQQVMVFAQGGDSLGRIDFTENDESIGFELDQHGALRVTPSYLDTELWCPAAEFVASGADFIRRELRRVTTEYPDLAGNEHVQELARYVDGGSPEGRGI